MLAGPAIPKSVADAHRESHRARRSFGPDDLEALLGLLSTADAVLSVGEATLIPTTERGGVIAMRHDVDHDLENSLRIARIEAERGYTASYYLLHTDWYYRRDFGEGAPSASVLEAAHELAELGHEVALHNNVVTQALLTDQRPLDVLARELGWLREAGFAVRGSVSHGDVMCHQLGYVNYEVFTECAKPSRGAPDRIIAYDDWESGVRHQVQLQPVPMASVGLDYEANLAGHQLYLSDTGGKWHLPIDEQRARFVETASFLQVLLHPVWWALDGEPSTHR